MKNKVFGILIALVIMIGVMASQVMAASISASSTEVNKGDEITVTVKLNEPTQAIDLTLSYDANSFEYVEKSVTSGLDKGSIVENATTAGKILISGADPYNSTNYVTYTFIAKEATDAAEFVASDLSSQSEEALDVSSVSVKVVEPVEEPQPEQPSEDQNNNNTPDQNVTVNPGETVGDQETGDGSENANKSDADAPKVDEDGNVITRLPQTGVTVYQIAGVVAVLAIVAAIVVRKIRK